MKTGGLLFSERKWRESGSEKEGRLREWEGLERGGKCGQDLLYERRIYFPLKNTNRCANTEVKISLGPSPRYNIFFLKSVG